MTNYNKRTIESYDAAAEEYQMRTSAVLDSSTKEWLNEALSLLPLKASVLEVGSGTGRDASYIEQQGFHVQRTEASKGLADRLASKDVPVRMLNLLADSIEGEWDMVFANAVLHHFSLSSLPLVMARVREALRPTGVFAFTVKEGTGESWETAKLGLPRYFQYLTPEQISELLQSGGFVIHRLDSGVRDEKGQAWVAVIARPAFA